MAYYAIERYPGDGEQTLFNVPFPFLDRAHVKVRVDGVEVDFTWITNGQISVAVAPALGQTLEIKRETPKTSKLVVFGQGNATLKAESLNLIADQNLYVVQEAIDRAEDTLSRDAEGNWNLGGSRAVGADDPVDDNDLVTKGYAEANYGGQAVTDSAANAAAALAARVGSEAARDASVSAKNASETARDASQAAQTLAEAARDAADQHRIDAEAAKNATEAMLNKDNFREVVYVTSPGTINIALADSGKLYVCDTTAGTVNFQMPNVATVIGQTPRFSIAIQKVNGANPVSVLPSYGETIKGEPTSLTISQVNQSAILIPDTDPTYDDWAALQMGTPLAANTVNTAQLVTGSVTNDKLEAGLNGRGYRHLSTAAPTSGDGANGDIWYKVV